LEVIQSITHKIFVACQQSNKQILQLQWSILRPVREGFNQQIERIISLNGGLIGLDILKV